MIPITTIISMRVKPEAEGRPPARRGLRLGGRAEISRLRPWADECGERNGGCRARVEPAMVGCVTGYGGGGFDGPIKSTFFIEKASKKQAVFRILATIQGQTARIVSERQGAGSKAQGAGNRESRSYFFSLRESGAPSRLEIVSKQELWRAGGSDVSLRPE